MCTVKHRSVRRFDICLSRGHVPRKINLRFSILMSPNFRIPARILHFPFRRSCRNFQHKHFRCPENHSREEWSSCLGRVKGTRHFGKIRHAAISFLTVERDAVLAMLHFEEPRAKRGNNLHDKSPFWELESEMTNLNESWTPIDTAVTEKT